MQGWGRTRNTWVILEASQPHLLNDIINKDRCWLLKIQGREHGREDEDDNEHVRKSHKTKSTNKNITCTCLLPREGVIYAWGYGREEGK